MNDVDVKAWTKAALALIVVGSMIVALFLSMLGKVTIPAEGMGVAGMIAGWLTSEAKTVFAAYFNGNGNPPDK